MNEIISYLDKLIPYPACELHYQKDYELLIAVMLSAQTTDKRVNIVTKVLFDKYPSLEVLNKAELEDIKNIIRSIGNYNKKALNIKLIAEKLITESNGKVPNNREFLESLSGVGRKTANVVLSNLFDEPYLAVDTHVARVSLRLGLAKPKDNVLTIEKKVTKLIPEDKRLRMHHQLVLFGRYYCKAKKPLCSDCELKHRCIEKQKSN
ncbi:MAG: endonuclease III [Bacilli bacterium]|nr:endonuclease III [Bacilli bacterium]